MSRALLAVLISVSMAGLASAGSQERPHSEDDAVLEWNEILVEHIAEMPPTDHTRLGAMMHVAILQAVRAASGASADAAAVSAAHRVLRSVIPEKAPALDAALQRSLQRIPEGRDKRAGIAVGEAAAAEIIASRQGDGSQPPESHLPESLEPGVWQLTPGCPPTGGVFLHWRKVAPFAMRRPDQFRSEPPPPLSSRRYTRDYEEVKRMGDQHSASRPQDRTDVARLYGIVGDGLLWNPIARQLAAKRRATLVQNARIFALLNVALADAAIAVIDTKYYYNYWRPETAIRAAAADGNDETEPQVTFVPLIETPCFPSYPSGHASLSHAARRVLEHFYGGGDHRIVIASAQLPGVVLEYSNLADITADIDDARVFGGIHFRFDQAAGEEQGRRLGNHVLRHGLRTRGVHAH
jgi:hypothetical protein